MNFLLKCNCKLAAQLRGAIPVEGVDFAKMILVQLKPGESIGKHQHAYHTALYYPFDAEPITITPTAGMIIYLPQGTPHAVPKVKGERTSIAMLVEPKE